MSWQKPKPKSIWTIKWEGDRFVLYDGQGTYSAENKSRHWLAERAFDYGADEVKHDYDLLAHP